MLGRRIVSLIDRFSVGLVYVAMGCVAFMMVIGVVDTLSVKLAGEPLPGYYELTEVSMVLIIFFSLAYVQRERKHISMTALTESMPARLQRSLEVLGLLVAIFAMFMVTWAGSTAAWRSVLVGEWYPGLVRFPVYPWKAALVLGAATLLIKLIADLVKSLAELLRPGTSSN
jgi:TRAP-type C4-dicarboxylate transport system permease small subunit